MVGFGANTGSGAAIGAGGVAGCGAPVGGGAGAGLPLGGMPLVDADAADPTGEALDA